MRRLIGENLATWHHTINPTSFGQAMKQVCQYDGKCYRKNPIHFFEYTHPKQYPNGKGADVVTSDSNMKKQKIEPFKFDFPDDILGQFIQYLTLEDLLCFKLSCKHFYDIVHSSFAILNWKGLTKDVKQTISQWYPDRFLEDFINVKEVFSGKQDLGLSSKDWYELWKDFCLALKIKQYAFDLPIDEMGTDTIRMQPILGIPKDKKQLYYPLLTTDVAEEKRREDEWFEHFPKLESWEGSEAFQAFKKEMEEGLIEFDNFDDEKKEDTKEYLANFMNVEEIMKKNKMGHAYYQKVHYYWDDGDEYNQGFMFFYGITQHGNLCGFSWTVYHNV